ncbi:MAG: DUF4159 domain-containing protein [Bacteroidetes bacterium]|nr:DUF4159 domain-containing protein [Bacteroidota bacterium]MBU1717440.1 DUF4159 domain-containing protein [Bacteroidota bacterium]
MKHFLIVFSLLLVPALSQAQVRIGLLKYGGGGDWYANPTSLPNLIKFCNANLDTDLEKDPDVIETGSNEIFNYPFIHMTGHGNVIFNNSEIENLRNYLIGGGFLHIDDNYGMDKYIRPMMKKVFPELDFVEIPFNHPIYHQKYDFSTGPPKIHEHDGKRPQGFGLFWHGRLIVYYSYEIDLGDGWEDPEVHKDSPAARTKALQMGANMIQYIFTQ